MPAQSGNKRSYDGSVKRWNNPRKGFQSTRGRQPTPLLSNFPAPLMNPWENGMTPGFQSGFGNQDPLFGGSNYRSAAFGPSGMSNMNSFSSKNRLFERVGGYDEPRGRGLLPSPPNAPLLGAAPPIYPHPQARGSEMLQQRLGFPWSNSPFENNGLRGVGSNSGYYPSSRGYSDSSRRFVKARRPAGKSPFSRIGKSDHRDAKNKPKGSGGGAQAKSDSNDKSHDDSAKPDREDDTKEKNDEEVEDTNKEEKKDGETEESTEKKEENQPEFPCHALFCHICEVGNFATKKGYIRHLQASTHARMSELFHAKNAATLELLNISAKLAEMRQKDKVLRRTGKKGQPVMKTTEQFLIQKMLKVATCCDAKFASPFELEEHKLSIYHLKEKYLSSLKTEASTEGGKMESDDSIMQDVPTKASHEVEDDDAEYFSSLIEEAKKKAESAGYSTDNVPIYNPSTMIGLDFLHKEIVFRCELCKGQTFKFVKQHCQSPVHYDNIVAFVNKTEDEKREATRLAEEGKKTKESKEQETVEESVDADMSHENDDENLNYSKDDDCGEAPQDDEDVIALGEEEERILNEGSNLPSDQGSDSEENEEECVDIFQEVGDSFGAHDEDHLKEEDEPEEAEEEEEEEEREVRYTRRSTRRSLGGKPSRQV